MASRRFFLLSILIAGVALAQAQNAMLSESDSILKEFENRFVVLDSLIFTPKVQNTKYDSNLFAQSAQKYGDTEIAEDLYNQALEKSVRAQARAIKAPTGLQITGQTYYRLDNAFGLNEDDEAISRYDTKVQAEMRWNFFNSRWWNTKGKIREAVIQSDIDRIAYAKETRGTEYARQREFYRSMQDSAMCRILSNRVKNLSMLSEAYMFLLNYENIPSDDIMLILSEKAEAERKLAGLTVRNLWATDLSSPDAFIVRLDTARFLRYVMDNQADFKIAQKRMDLFEQRAKDTRYWDDVDISPFLRYSLYLHAFHNASSNVDVGIYFKLPLNNIAGKQRQALRAQGEALGAEQYLRKRQVADEVAYVATEVERLNNSIQGEYNRSIELKKYIDLRKKAYENRKGEYNRLARMKEYNAYLLCLERLLEFQYSRDQQIATLAKFLAGENVSDFCTIENLASHPK